MESAQSTPRLLRPRELADALGISTETLRRLQHEGRVKPIYLGPNSPRYDYEETLQLLRETDTHREDQ